MDKRPAKKLRLQKENLKVLKSDQLARANAGAASIIIIGPGTDPWEATFSCTIA